MASRQHGAEQEPLLQNVAGSSLGNNNGSGQHGYMQNDLEFLLESGPSDLRCRGVDGPVTVTLSEDVLQVVDTSSGHVAREVWLQDITAVYLRPRGDSTWESLSRRNSNSSYGSTLAHDDEDAEIVIVSFPLCAEHGACSKAIWCCLCCYCCSCCCHTARKRLSCCSSSSDANNGNMSSSTSIMSSSSQVHASSSPCCGPRLVRDEMEEIVLSADTPDLVHHWEYAIVAAVSGKNSPDVCISKSKRMLVIISPQSGQGRAGEIFASQVKPIFEASRISCEVVETKGPMDAMHIVLHHQDRLHELDGIIVVGGDGIIFEAMQGLKRIAGSGRIHVPVGAIPAGSGNGIAASLHHAVNEPINDPISAAIGIARGRVQALDMWKVDMLHKDGHVLEPCFASLSIAWAFVSDTDIESEPLRALGGARFTVQAVINLFRLRKYSSTFSYLPFDATQDAQTSEDLDGEGLAVDAPAPVTWTSVSGKFLLLWALNVTHPSSTSNLVPEAAPDSGCIEIVLVRDISRVDFVRGLLALDTGEQFDVPGWERIRASAFRIEALAPETCVPGKLVVDGELLSEPLQRIQVQATRAQSDFFSYLK
ncbi:Sphingosine kinase 1 [Hondaea fermentalgiana]|uniref:Sphingosine kinase 1 n=1 Tax=Hondaea fermentalgiana TaxID=2315210 RepID=A0A2R5GT83_9STRA|nr:Sphingosine kinase 1 [Hondaea fermentalgiana]|eukprot:GBG34076.1 Sphingosine kinase 1 [Hondaea fermentalgiana]